MICRYGVDRASLRVVADAHTDKDYLNGQQAWRAGAVQ